MRLKDPERLGVQSCAKASVHEVKSSRLLITGIVSIATKDPWLLRTTSKEAQMEESCTSVSNHYFLEKPFISTLGFQENLT